MGCTMRGWMIPLFGMLAWLYTTLPSLAMDAPDGPRFTHYQVDTSKPMAEACLVFSRSLDAKQSQQYGDYLKIIPEARPALRVEDKRLCLSGLAFATPYDITILKGLPGADGGRGKEGARVTVDLGNRKAKVSFTGNGAFILPRRTTGTIGLESINVEEVWLTIHRLGERMMVPDLQSLIKLTDNQLYAHALQQLIRQHTTPVWSGVMKVKKEHNQRVFTTLPFSDLVQERQAGAYLITAQDAKRAKRIPMQGDSGGEDDYDYDDYEDAATQWVVDTDIGLSLLKGRDGLHLYTRSLLSGAPLAQLSLSLLAVNNEELGRVTTDSNGAARFDPGLLRGARGLTPAMVVARSPEGDFTLLDLKRPAFDLSDRGVAGRAHPGEVDAFLYSDRGIYRPGETVHLTALTRNPAVIGLAAQSLTLITRRPNGSEFRRVLSEASGEGAHVLDLALPATAARGLWQVTALLPGHDQPVGQLSFDVQDFVPQRLKVLASLPEPPLQVGDKVAVAVDGVFLYGAPASGLKGEGELVAKVDSKPFDAFKEYLFGRYDEVLPTVKIPLTLADTDAKGHTRAEGQLLLPREFSKPLKAEITVRLVEPGGRTTHTLLEKAILSKKPLVGIRPLFSGGQVREQEKAQFHVALVSPNGEALNRAKVKFALYEEKRNHHWFYRDERWQVQTVREDRLLEQGTVDVAAGKPGQVAAALDWGRYRLEVVDPETAGQGSYAFQVGWGGTGNADVPDRAEVLANKPRYQPGEKARIKITPPAPGPVQVVVATDRVWESHALVAGEGGITLEIPVNSEWGAGAYVLVTSFRPMNKGKARDPVRAMGVVWLGIDPDGHALQVAMTPPELFRPNQRLEVPVKVTGGAGEKVYLTLAAVDEGILQLTRFKSPDPLDHFMGKRRLAVEVRDDYGRLLDGGQGPLGEIRSGGDSPGGAGLPVVPVTSVALFSGLVATDENGEALVPLDIPDFNGKLRLMAVAHSRSRVGAAEGEVTVRHPLVGEVSLPRFLAPGDLGRLTLLVQNMDAPSGEVRVRLAAEGAVTLPEGFHKTWTLSPQDRMIETVAIQAREQSGIGKVVLQLTGEDGFALERSWSIAVRSPYRPVTVEESSVHKGGESWTLPTAHLGDYENEGVRVAVHYGLQKEMDVPGMLQSLALYPFGCTEQLTSRALALLYHGDSGLLAAVGSQMNLQGRAATQEILNQILERQDADGSIGLYRAGDGGVGHYLAGYVVDMLRLAAERGFFVPETALKSAYHWLRESSSQYTNQEYSTYLLYALSRVGEANSGELRYLHDNRLDKLPTALDRAALGAALYQVGDVARSVNAFNRAVAHMDKRKEGGEFYSSALQEWGAILALALESRQERVATAALAGVARHIKPASQLNTHEKGWLLRAASSMAAGEPMHVALNGQESGVAGKGTLSFVLTEWAGANFVNKGKGELWRTVAITGVPLKSPPPVENGLSIDRKLFSLSGELVDPAMVGQNQRFIVSLRGRLKEGSHRHLVLVDMLPAGWEIEGVVSRDDEGRSVYPFLPKLTILAAREVRDDRFVASFDMMRRDQWNGGEEEGNDGKKPASPPLEPNEFHLAYTVRAVTPGRFFLPPPMVEDMYRATVFGRGKVGLAVVAQP